MGRGAVEMRSLGQVARGPGLRRLLLLLPLLSLSSCSDRALEIFFDIPPPTAEEKAAEAKAQAEAQKAEIQKSQAAVEAPAKTPEAAAIAKAQKEPPEIEKIFDWKKARAMLPKDAKGRKGKVNWTQAVREGIIRPRESIDGSPRPPGYVFRYDFFIPSEEKGFEAYFPHSTHTEWLACESCHPRIFPTRDITYTKRDLKKGKYCGVCHAKKNGTAFWLRSCDRCHPKAS